MRRRSTGIPNIFPLFIARFPYFSLFFSPILRPFSFRSLFLLSCLPFIWRNWCSPPFVLFRYPHTRVGSIVVLLFDWSWMWWSCCLQIPHRKRKRFFDEHIDDSSARVPISFSYLRFLLKRQYYARVAVLATMSVSGSAAHCCCTPLKHVRVGRKGPFPATRLNDGRLSRTMKWGYCRFGCCESGPSATNEMTEFRRPDSISAMSRSIKIHFYPMAGKIQHLFRCACSNNLRSVEISLRKCGF